MWAFLKKVETQLRQAFVIFPFEFFWGQIPQRGMTTGAIIEAFNIGEDIGFGFLTGLKILKMHMLIFQGAEETLHRRIIVAVPGPAHADLDVLSGQQSLVRRTRILAAALALRSVQFE